MTDDEIIGAYLEHVENAEVSNTSDRASFSAWEVVTELIDTDPERAWMILLESLRRCSSGHETAIGAGPLEELIVKEPLRFAERVAEQLISSGRFRSAFEAVYFSTEYVSPADADHFNSVLRARGVHEEFIPDWRIASPEGAV